MFVCVCGGRVFFSLSFTLLLLLFWWCCGGGVFFLGGGSFSDSFFYWNHFPHLFFFSAYSLLSLALTLFCFKVVVFFLSLSGLHFVLIHLFYLVRLLFSYSSSSFALSSRNIFSPSLSDSHFVIYNNIVFLQSTLFDFPFLLYFISFYFPFFSYFFS